MSSPASPSGEFPGDPCAIVLSGSGSPTLSTNSLELLEKNSSVSSVVLAASEYVATVLVIVTDPASGKIRSYFNSRVEPSFNSSTKQVTVSTDRLQKTGRLTTTVLAGKKLEITRLVAVGTPVWPLLYSILRNIETMSPAKMLPLRRVDIPEKEVAIKVSSPASPAGPSDRLIGRTTSQTSPTPSWSESNWSGLLIPGQLSRLSSMPSLSSSVSELLPMPSLSVSTDSVESSGKASCVSCKAPKRKMALDFVTNGEVLLIANVNVS